MILADTSVWIQHLRQGNDRLGGLLSDGEVACHPFVIGELACGNLKNRAEVLLLLGRLPSSAPATDDEVLMLIGARRLMGRGLGWIDAHLLGAAVLPGFPAVDAGPAAEPGGQCARRGGLGHIGGGQRPACECSYL